MVRMVNRNFQWHCEGTQLERRGVERNQVRCCELPVRCPQHQQHSVPRLRYEPCTAGMYSVTQCAVQERADLQHARVVAVSADELQTYRKVLVTDAEWQVQAWQAK
jgi:hypothetical protein